MELTLVYERHFKPAVYLGTNEIAQSNVPGFSTAVFGC